MNARTETAKAAVLGRLLSCWIKPGTRDLRLGQLLACVQLVGDVETVRKLDLWSVEDEELAKLVEEFCNVNNQ
jgi:hypothetical protein